MSYITTFTGKHFDPVAVDSEQIDVRDIAHALSLMCRGNGHVSHFYSVGQHCINCCREAQARGLSARIQLACLLHDAAEAYLTDVTRPVKAMLPEYIAMEDHLLDAIWEKYLGSVPTTEEQREVFAIDDDMMSYEFSRIMPEMISEDYRNIISAPQTDALPPEEVEQAYRKQFDKYNSTKSPLKKLPV